MMRKTLPLAVLAVSVVSACDEDTEIVNLHRFEFRETAQRARVNTWFRKEGLNECCTFDGIQRYVFGKEETYADCIQSCKEWPRCVGFERVEEHKSACVLLTTKDDDHFRSHVNTMPCTDGEKRQCRISSYFEDWEFQEVYKQRCSFAGLRIRDEDSRKFQGVMTFTDCRDRCFDDPQCVAFDIGRSGNESIGEQECTHYFALNSEDPRETLTWLTKAFDSSLAPVWSPYTCVMKRKTMRGVAPSEEARDQVWCEDQGWQKVVKGGNGRRL